MLTRVKKMATIMPIGMHTAVGVVVMASKEGDEGTCEVASKAAVGTRAEDDRATKGQAPTACPSVLPSGCHP